MLNVTDLWKAAYPGASVGVLVLRNVVNPQHNDALENSKRVLENKLRATFSDRTVLLNHPHIQAYTAYYKHFAKTYHVEQQLESILFKGKKIPSTAGLVEAMFMAELKNGLLTAGHDYETLKFPLTLTASSGYEKYILINGKEQLTKVNDMMIADSDGIISSIIHGPDLRSRLTPTTTHALFVVYAVPGIAQSVVLQHLSDIHGYVSIVAPQAQLEYQQVLS
jgi:DNA/RNA-binding domain of Phe-tRNA-synthetase-like protein